MTFMSLLLLLVFLSPYVEPQTSADMKHLITDIFVTNGYNKFVRPNIDLTDPTVVNIDLFLVGIREVDEVKETLTTTAYLELKWTDEHLQWDFTKYNGTFELLLPQSEIWRPDLALQNSINKLEALGDGFMLLRIRFSGDVYWFPYEVFETKCTINIEYFPFDVQECAILIGVWTSSTNEIGQQGIVLDFFDENGEWDLISTSAKTTVSITSQVHASYAMTLKRKPEYYIYNIVVPILLLSLLSIFTFVIPVESGEKLGFGMTLYLAFAVFLTIVSASLPISSSMSLMGKYLIFLLCTSTLVIVITTFQLRIHFRDESREIPICLKLLVQYSRLMQCRKCRRSKVEDSGELSTGNIDEDNSKKVKWPDVSAAIDFYCFWTFLITVVIGTLVLFMNSYSKNYVV